MESWILGSASLPAHHSAYARSGATCPMFAISDIPRGQPPAMASVLREPWEGYCILGCPEWFYRSEAAAVSLEELRAASRLL